MNVKLLVEQHLGFLSLKGGCTGSSESIHVKMPHCWKSHVAAQIVPFEHRPGYTGLSGLFSSYNNHITHIILHFCPCNIEFIMHVGEK